MSHELWNERDDMNWNESIGYVVIKPKPELEQKLQELTTDTMTIKLLLSTILWEYVHSTHSRWSHEVHETKIKVQFLAYLYDSYVLDNDDRQIANVVNELLGPAPIRYTAFDKWWSTSGFELVENSKEVEQDLDITTLEQFARTGNFATDQWLEGLIEEKKIQK